MRKLFLLTLLGIVFASCSSIDKQHFKAREFYMKNKTELAILCSSEFPVRPEYIKGDTIKTKEVIYLPSEQVECPDGTKKDCPPPKHTKEIQRITDTIKVPDLATEAKLRNEISELTSNNVFLSKDKERALKELKEAKEDFKQKEKEHKLELRKLNWIIGGLGLIIVFLSIVILKRR